MKVSKIAKSLEEIINDLPTFDQRMAAYGILDLLTDGDITDREALRQLSANNIIID